MSFARKESLAKALGGTVSISLVPICVRAVEADAINIGIIRLVIAITVLGTFFCFRHSLPKLTKSQWVFLLFIGLLFGGHWLSFFVSIKLSSASVAVIGLSTYGIHLVLLNWLINKKQPHRRNFIAIAAAILGSYLVIPEFSLENNHTLGLMIGVLSGFVYALVPILHQKSQEISANLRTLAQFSFALVFFTLLWPFSDGHVASADWPILLFMGIVCTLIGHGLWVRATTELPIQVTSCIFYTGLPFTLFFEWTLLGKSLDVIPLCGAALILFANLLNIEWRQHSVDGISS